MVLHPIWSDVSGKILGMKGRCNGSTMLVITSVGVTLSLTLVTPSMVESISAKLNPPHIKLGNSIVVNICSS